MATGVSGSNLTSNCYEVAPSNKHYNLKWKAQGSSFFDDWTFATGHSATSGASYYLDKDRAVQEGIISTSDHHAKMRVGRAYDTSSGPRRFSASISTKKRYKHFLGVLKYQHVPFGLGVWPAFWMNGPGTWPEGGELDVLEYASHDGQKVSLHTGKSNHCKLSATEVTKCTEMPDSNNMGYDCYTNYGAKKLGCAPTTFAGQRPPEFWSSNPGALAIEWTERFLKVYYFPDADIPDDLDTDTPTPFKWDEKFVIAYFPFAASEERHPGYCPNYQNVMDAQKIIMNIELCGDWAGSKWEPWDQDPYAKEWRGKRDRGECKIHGYHTANDCCANYIGQSKLDQYLHDHAHFDINYLKIFQLESGSPDSTPRRRRTTRRRRSVPAPTPGICTKTWYEDTDCDGKDILNVKMDTAEGCCELCGNTSGCYAFTHNVFDGHLSPTCYLKTGCDSSARAGKRGCTSGKAEKAPAPPTPPTPPGQCGNYLENTDCAGADLSNLPMKTADDCCKECSETDGCAAFTHNVADGHGEPYCYLKKKCDKSDRSWKGGCTSGSGILPQPGTRRRRRRRSSTSGCCSWADNNDCGETTAYCKANIDNCVVCGGHWVPKGHWDSETVMV